MNKRFQFIYAKWLHIHGSTTNICLYSSSSPCPLPINSLSSVWKSSKVSGQLLLRDSSDKFVSEANVPLKAGQWQVGKAIKDAENQLDFNKILGYHQTHKAGFGSLSLPEVPPKQSHEYRKLLSSLVTEFDEELYHAKAVQLGLQGHWTKWCSFVKQDFSWKNLLGLPHNLLSFCIGATYDTLPSPSKLHRWSISTEKSCFLCKKNICTTAHVLGACKIALKQGRYTYRHDAVLKILVSELQSFLSSPRDSSVPSRFIKFVKEGSNPKKTKKKKTGILCEASDWVLLNDLGKLVIPSFIAVSSLRPDILIFSPSTKRVVLIELTCPCEENMEDWHKSKFHKYNALATSMRKNGWFVDLFQIEVGTRGYCAVTVKTCLLRLGFQGKQVCKILKSVSTESLKTSFEIWLSRDTFDWTSKEFPNANFLNKNSRSDMVSSKELKRDKAECPQTKKTSHVDFQKSVLRVPVRANCGIINKGNTCYLNASLQCLSTMENFWSNLTPFSTSLSPLVLSFVKIMSLLRTSKQPVDPSFFKTLANYLSKIR